MADDRQAVKNAADPRQVKAAERNEKDKRELELDDLRALLKTAEGRRFLWRLIGQCRTFESIWTANAQIHYNAGQQDLGHFLIAEIVEADEEGYLLMQQESYAAEKLRRQQADALRKKRAGEQNESERTDDDSSQAGG
jgi:hypothetical protein